MNGIKATINFEVEADLDGVETIKDLVAITRKEAPKKLKVKVEIGEKIWLLTDKEIDELFEREFDKEEE